MWWKSCGDPMVMPLDRLIKFARKSPSDMVRAINDHWKKTLFVPRLENDRTAYIVGLFGTGRMYINDLIVDNIGRRAQYFCARIVYHPGRTSMIYSGHATMKYISRWQQPPSVTERMLAACRDGRADSIFIYRHPLDSLLTNWVWCRTYIRSKRMVSGISSVYKNTDELCADLDRNFAEFMAFVEGDPGFFVNMPGPPFLSFTQFVEETVLHRRSATLALRLEDFMTDPVKEFRKIVEVMSAERDANLLNVARPKAKLYGYRAVQEKLPKFRNFVDRLGADTKKAIEDIGYDVVG